MNLAFFAGAIRRLLRAKASARANFDFETGSAGPLREGAAHVSGEVAYADGADVAMRIVFEQEGSESSGSRGGWSHEWREVGRSAVAVPFFVVTPDGARIRVEPSAKSLLCDDLEATSVPGPRSADGKVRASVKRPCGRVNESGRAESSPGSSARRSLARRAPPAIALRRAQSGGYFVAGPISSSPACR
jgi:hypothetical protein